MPLLFANRRSFHRLPGDRVRELARAGVSGRDAWEGVRQTNPIPRAFGLKMWGQALRKGRDCFGASLLAMTGGSPGPRFAKRSQFPRWAARSTEAGNVKQSQFRPGGGRRGRSRPGNPKLETRKTSGGARMGTGAPNEPNLGVFGPEMGAAMKNKANLPGCWAEQAGRAGAPPASCPAGPVLVGSGFAVANQRAMKADWKG